jgi:hydrogenase expression/formation protein HypC
MCIAIPGKVLSVDGFIGVCDFFGEQRSVYLHLCDEPAAVGDYILDHLGYAVRRIPEEDIEGTLQMYRELTAPQPLRS